MFILDQDPEIFYNFYLITLYLFIALYKKKCILAAKHARINKDFNIVYKTCVIYAKQHFERVKKLKKLKHDVIQDEILRRGKI